jgi:cytochrome P450
MMRMSLGLFRSNGAQWSRMRRLIAPSFSVMNVQAKFTLITEELQNLTSKLRERALAGELVLIDTEAFSFTTRIISRAAFGLGPDNPSSSYFYSSIFLDDLRSIVYFMFTSNPLPVWLRKRLPKFRYEKRAVEADTRLSASCQQIIDYKRALSADTSSSGTHSLIDSLLSKQAKEGEEAHAGLLTDEEIIQNVKIFYIGGTDTSANTIAWLCYFLCLYPEVQQQVRHEAAELLFSKDGSAFAKDASVLQHMKYTAAVVRESMRLKNVLSLLTLDLEDGVAQATLSNGINVLQHDTTLIYLDGILWDEDIFQDAQAFKPERWLQPNVTAAMEEAFVCFGSGPRVCPGMNLALVEATLAIAYLTYAFEMQLGCPAEEIKRVMNTISVPNKMPLYLKPLRLLG